MPYDNTARIRLKNCCIESGNGHRLMSQTYNMDKWAEQTEKLHKNKIQ